MTESTFSFDCEGTPLVGIVHRPSEVDARRRGVLIVVGGGPQFRVGGHRQLTLWARRLCAEGYPVMRFDYRGMGDAHGDFRGFLDVDTDIRCAIDRFCAEVPELEEIVLWGECDASSAILLYSWRDARVKGAVLLNPWVRTESSQAKTVLKHYYLERLLEPSFWKKVLGGGFNPMASARSMLDMVQRARAGAAPQAANPQVQADAPIPRSLPLPDSMVLGLERFKGHVMLVLSGRDLIAREFEDLIGQSPRWKAALGGQRVGRHDMPDGDHTFSSALLRGQVVDWGLQWLKSW